jgi:hypothetical protein
LLKQKAAQKVAIILGYFILSKNHNEPPKEAQLAKIAQSCHPVPGGDFPELRCLGIISLASSGIFSYHLKKYHLKNSGY